MRKIGQNSPYFINRVGEKFITNQGFNIEIIKCLSHKDITVRFDDGTLKDKLDYGNIKRGSVEKPYNRIGEKFITKQGYEIEVVEYNSATNCEILFIETGNIKNTTYGQVKSGEISNPLHKSVLGVGFEGVGKYNFKDFLKIQKLWFAMLTRCYSERYQITQSSYKDVTVCEEWHNFQNFAKWAEENWKPYMDKSWQLDKDVICKDCRVYSSSTCAFLPAEINGLFVARTTDVGYRMTPQGNYMVRMSKTTGRVCYGRYASIEEASNVYKTEKEKYVKEVADKWRDKIDFKAYESMYKWTLSNNLK